MVATEHAQNKEGPPRPILAIIFDHDGLLADTEDHWFRASQQVCSKRGAIVTEEHRLHMMASSLSQYLIDTFTLNIPRDVISQELDVEFTALTSSGVIALPGAIEAVQILSGRYPLAVGTGSPRKHAEAGLKNLGIIDYFKTVVCKEGDLRGKPFPDIYWEAARRLAVDPAACVVFEDQPKGIQAAKAAGMFCITVPNKYLSENVDFSAADILIPSLEAVDLDFMNVINFHPHFKP